MGLHLGCRDSTCGGEAPFREEKLHLGGEIPVTPVSNTDLVHFINPQCACTSGLQ